MNQILYKGEVFGGVGEDVTNKKKIIDNVEYTGGQNSEIFNDYRLNISEGEYSTVFGCGNKELDNNQGIDNGYNVITGLNNKIENSSKVWVGGSGNNIKKLQESIIYGYFNNIAPSDMTGGLYLFGDRNTINGISDSSDGQGLVIGRLHTIGSSQSNGGLHSGCFIMGLSNQIAISTKVHSSFIGGQSNTADQCTSTIVFGGSNEANILNQCLVVGTSVKTFTDISSIIFGSSTEANNITNSLVGSSNSKINEVADSIVLGMRLSGGTIDDVVQPTAPIEQSLVIGYGHTIRNTIVSTNILGASHTINTPLYYSTVLGRENTINQNQYSFITGYQNNLTGTSPNSTFNVIGNSNALTSGDNTLVLGSNNTITGSGANITILGNSNLAVGGNSNIYAFGTGLYMPGGCSNVTILGSYNTTTSINPTTNTSLLIGNGTDNNNRSDAYEIKKDGTQIFYFKDKNLTNTLGIGKITLQQDLITIESLKTNSNNQKESVTFTFEELKQLKTISQLPDLDNNQYPNNNI